MLSNFSQVFLLFLKDKTLVYEVLFRYNAFTIKQADNSETYDCFVFGLKSIPKVTF